MLCVPWKCNKVQNFLIKETPWNGRIWEILQKPNNDGIKTQNYFYLTTLNFLSPHVMKLAFHNYDFS